MTKEARAALVVVMMGDKQRRNNGIESIERPSIEIAVAEAARTSSWVKFILQ